MTPNNFQENNPPDHNTAKGFSVGLFLGVVGGMATYYMFNSEQGKKLKDKLIHEYDRVATDLPDMINQAAQAAEEKLDHLAQEAPITTTEAAATTTQTIAQTKSLLHRLSEKVSSMTTSHTSSTQTTAMENQAQPVSRKQKPTKKFFKKSGRSLNSHG